MHVHVHVQDEITFVYNRYRELVERELMEEIYLSLYLYRYIDISQWESHVGYLLVQCTFASMSMLVFDPLCAVPIYDTRPWQTQQNFISNDILWCLRCVIRFWLFNKLILRVLHSTLPSPLPAIPSPSAVVYSSLISSGSGFNIRASDIHIPACIVGYCKNIANQEHFLIVPFFYYKAAGFFLFSLF